MNDQQLIERIAATDAYGADATLPDGLHPDIVLLEIERRKHMDTRERTTPMTPMKPKRRWSGALIAAVAAVVVILIGVTAALLAGNRTEEPVATTTTEATTPTTVATSRVPSAETAEFPFVSSMGVDLTNGDASRILASIEGDTEFPIADPDQPIRSAEDVENYLAYGIALESSWGRGVCTMGAGGIATCELIRTSDAFDPYAGVDSQVMLVKLRLDGDTASSFAIEFTTHGSDNWLTRELAFMAWLEETHPNDYAQLYTRPASDGVWAPNWSDPGYAASLIRERVPEYLASSDR